MAYYHECPTCGAALDPGEVCEECREKEKAAVGAANTDGGEAEQKSGHAPCSASIITHDQEDLQP